MFCIRMLGPPPIAALPDVVVASILVVPLGLNRTPFDILLSPSASPRHYNKIKTSA
jgi:hypothetical protein